MRIQSSINSLLSQAQSLAAFYKGFEKAGDLIKGQEAQTEATKSLQEAYENMMRFNKEQLDNELFDKDGNLSRYGESYAQDLDKRVKGNGVVSTDGKQFYNNPKVQEYLKSFAANSKLKNEVAGKVARASVEARTDSINKTKSNFDEHTASLIKYYSKGSGNP